MTTPSSQEVTRLLLAWRNGDQEALERLTPLVYGELRRMAHRFMRRERPDHTLQSSALVNEAYIRLIDCHQVDWQNRAHFFGIAAQMMRQILIDHARRHARARRGGGLRQVSFEETAIVSVERAAELIALDDALNDLAAFDLGKCRIVELRFFGGLTNEEVGEVMGMTLRTVEREWRKAKAWLRRAISKRDESDEFRALATD
jgi:RNA polymerase sigma factor (TIGR02999 family)